MAQNRTRTLLPQHNRIFTAKEKKIRPPCLSFGCFLSRLRGSGTVKFFFSLVFRERGPDKCFGTVQNYQHTILDMFQGPAEKVVIFLKFLFFIIKAISGP